MYKKVALTISLFIFWMFSYTILAQDLASTNSDLVNKSHVEDCADSSEVIKPAEPLESVDQPAEFPGGVSELMKYINKNLHYPISSYCDTPRIEGRVAVRLIVTKNGYIRDAQVVHSVNKDFNMEALRIVNSMPKWIPAKKRW